MRTALVIGANGQDGTFLVRHLLRRGYAVVGADVQSSSRWDLQENPFTYQSVDLRHYGTLHAIIRSVKPDFVFHVAAVHTSAGGAYETFFNDVLKVNVGSVHEALEYLREQENVRFIYASSAKVFGTPLPELINENTPKKIQDLYSISKNTAYDLIEYYRSQHGIIASVVYFFNHESELRPDDFFIPTVIRCLASAIKNTKHTTQINNLEFYCDWGSAEEYMDLLIDLIEKAPREDFVIARGETTHARNLIKNLFNNYQLDYQKHIQERQRTQSLLQPPYFVDLSKLNKHIHRRPKTNIYDVCKQILKKKYCL